MDMQNWPKSDWENVYYGLKEISRKMEKIMFECGDDEKAKRFAQDCVDSIDTWLENCKRKGHIEAHTLDLTSSRKPIKSTFGGNAVFEIMDDKLTDARRNIRSCISINPRRELDNELQNIDELIGDALTHTEMVKNGDYDNYMSPVNNSRKPIKSVRVIEAPNDFNEYNATAKDCIRYELDGTPFSKFLDDDFCKRVIDNIVGNYEVSETEVKDAIDYYKRQAKAEQVNSSHKPIKSSLEDRLVPYLEEFEEGYADALTSTDEMGNNARLDTFYEIFKNDYNLTDDDISKLEGAVQDIWHETEEENVEHDMGEMYGAPHGATPEEALKVFESRKVIKSSVDKDFSSDKEFYNYLKNLGFSKLEYDEDWEDLYFRNRGLTYVPNTDKPVHFDTPDGGCDWYTLSEFLEKYQPKNKKNKLPMDTNELADWLEKQGYSVYLDSNGFYYGEPGDDPVMDTIYYVDGNNVICDGPGWSDNIPIRKFINDTKLTSSRPEEALKVFESKKPIKSGSMSGYFSGICDKCKQFTNVHYVGYNGRKLCARCSRGR